MSRPWRRCLVMVWATMTCACTTVDGPSPEVGTLRPVLRNGALGTQGSQVPTLQVMVWHLDSLTATIAGTGGESTFSFLPLGGCDYRDNVFVRGDFRAQCRGYAGVVLESSFSSTVVFRLEISSLLGFRGERPRLDPGGDEDGDGVPNLLDSCKLVPNPDQVSSSDYRACAISDPETSAILDSDQDLDAVGDSRDNCLWVANPLEDEGSQVDSDGDGIGDACSVVVPVVIPGASTRLECPATFPSPDGTYIIDFGEQGALNCDPGLRSCTLDPSKVTIRPLTGATQSAPCQIVP